MLGISLREEGGLWRDVFKRLQARGDGMQMECSGR